MQIPGHRLEIFWGGGYANASANVIDAGISSATQLAINQQNIDQAQWTTAQNEQQAAIQRNFNAAQADIGFNRQEALTQQQDTFNADQAAQNRAFQAAQTTQQLDFQAQQSSTAEQRRVADLKAAGLNPLLAATAGAAQAMPGASASGAQASGGIPGAPTAQAGGFAGAAQAQLRAPDLSGLGDIFLKNSQARLANAQADKISGHDVPLVDAETAKTQQETMNLANQYKITTVQAKVVQDNIASLEKMPLLAADTAESQAISASVKSQWDLLSSQQRDLYRDQIMAAYSAQLQEAIARSHTAADYQRQVDAVLKSPIGQALTTIQQIGTAVAPFAGAVRSFIP